ncbi:MAG: response regulator transcription factor [Vulcanimicrobiaceae bacterium]
MRSPLEIAAEAANDALAQFALAHVRVWLVEPPGKGEAILAGSATAQSNIVYGGLSAQQIATSLEVGASMLHAKPSADAREGTIPGGAYLGVPIVADGVAYGYVECYSDGAIGFAEAAAVEAWAAQLGIALLASNQTTALESPRRGHVLIADDDPAIRKLLQTLLSRNGFTVTAVSNGLLAFETAHEVHPDLILLDWMMPILDGRSAAHKLKSDERTRHIPIVMLTSQARTEDKVSALEAGAQDYITKPFDSRELVARIEQQMRWRKLLADDAPAPQVPGEQSQPEQLPAPQSPPPYVDAPPPADGDFWNAAVQAQQLGKLREALTHYLAEAERSETAKQYPRAAIAFRSASVVAGQLQNLDLSNKFLRLAGKMYLSWAETSNDGKAIQDAYVNAARCFLSAGNLKLARKSVEIAESMHSVISDDRPSTLH